MAAGADMASVTCTNPASLTQSSILLMGKGMNAHYVRQIINLTQTTSGSYLLLATLIISRKNLALNGPAIFKTVMDMAQYARTRSTESGLLRLFQGACKRRHNP